MCAVRWERSKITTLEDSRTCISSHKPLLQQLAQVGRRYTPHEGSPRLEFDSFGVWPFSLWTSVTHTRLPWRTRWRELLKTTDAQACSETKGAGNWGWAWHGLFLQSSPGDLNEEPALRTTGVDDMPLSGWTITAVQNGRALKSAM